MSVVSDLHDKTRVFVMMSIRPARWLVIWCSVKNIAIAVFLDTTNVRNAKLCMIVVLVVPLESNLLIPSLLQDQRALNSLN